MSEASRCVKAATWIRVVSMVTGYSEEVLSAYVNMLHRVAEIVVAYDEACEWEQFIDALAPGMITPGGIDVAVIGMPLARHLQKPFDMTPNRPKTHETQPKDQQ